MKILVTGGAGFIGSHIVDKYIELGHEVAVVDNLSTGFRNNLNSKAVFYEVDIRNYKRLKYIFEEFRPDIINHHAAQMSVSRSLKQPNVDAMINIVGSVNLLELAKEFEVTQMIYASTGGAIYGEPTYVPVKEMHPITPLSQYGITKFTVEQYLRLYHNLYGLRFIALRYPNVYGPRQNPFGEAGVIAIFAGKMIKKETPTIFGSGEQYRDYVYVSDIVDANALVLGALTCTSVNIGSGIGTTVNQLYQKLSCLLNFKHKAIYKKERNCDVFRISLDASHLHRVFGWIQKVSLDIGLKLTADFLRKEKKRQ